MAQQVSFIPIMVKNKELLSTVPLKEGQYIVIVDSNEIYLDRRSKLNNSIVRDRLSYQVTIGANEPIEKNFGDLWFVTD